MTANVQLSGKTNDGRIFVVGAGNTDEFLIELAADVRKWRKRKGICTAVGAA